MGTIFKVQPDAQEVHIGNRNGGFSGSLDIWGGELQLHGGGFDINLFRGLRTLCIDVFNIPVDIQPKFELIDSFLGGQLTRYQIDLSGVYSYINDNSSHGYDSAWNKIIRVFDQKGQCHSILEEDDTQYGIIISSDDSLNNLPVLECFYTIY